MVESLGLRQLPAIPKHIDSRGVVILLRVFVGRLAGEMVSRRAMVGRSPGTCRLPFCTARIQTFLRLRIIRPFPVDIGRKPGRQSAFHPALSTGDTPIASFPHGQGIPWLGGPLVATFRSAPDRRRIEARQSRKASCDTFCRITGLLVPFRQYDVSFTCSFVDRLTRAKDRRVDRRTLHGEKSVLHAP